MTLFFFSVKAQMLLFSNLMTRGPRGDLHSVNFSLNINMSTNIFRISKNFKVKFTLCKSPRGPAVIKIQKSNISAFTGIKINAIAFLDRSLPQFKTRYRKQSKNVDTCWQARRNIRRILEISSRGVTFHIRKIATHIQHPSPQRYVPVIFETKVKKRNHPYWSCR